MDYNWDIDREYRIPISAGALIPTSEVNVPMYYDLANLSGVNDFWENIELSGGDLIITSSDGETQLPLEVVWVSAGSKQGEIYFKDTGSLLTSASSTKNIYYIYFGKVGATQPSVSSTYGRNNVWNNYHAVYHLNNLNESTGKASTLTNVNGATQSASDFLFNGTNQYLSFNNVAFTSIQNLTFETFINVDPTGNILGTVLRGRDNVPGIPATGPGIRQNKEIEYHWSDQGDTYSYDPDKVVPENQWFFYGLRVSPTSGTFRVSGTDTTNSVTHNAITCTSAVVWRIGDDPNNDRFFKGRIGEVRILSGTASQGWTITQENMFNTNNIFWDTSTSIQTRTIPPTPPTPDYNWDIDRNYRIPISAGSLIPSSQTNVPMYYDLQNLSGVSAFWENIQTSGGDLLVTSSDGETQLPLEVVWVSAGSKQGEIYFKDTGSLLSSASSTLNKYYLYFGNTSATQPSVSSTYGRNNVWNDYYAVYHLNNLNESTGKASTLTNVNSVTQSSASDYLFAGTNQYLSFNNVAFTSIQNLTFETFINVDPTGNDPGTVLRGRDPGAGIPATGPGIRQNKEIEYHWGDQGDTYNYDPNKVVPENQWFFYGLRVSPTSGTFRVSGTDTTNSVTHNAITCTNTVVWRIGNDPGLGRNFKGRIGEVRLLSGTASQEWTTIQENMFNRNSVFWGTSTTVEIRTPISTRLINIRSILRGVSRGVLIGMY